LGVACGHQADGFLWPPPFHGLYVIIQFILLPQTRYPVTPENWGKAIGAYERTLVSRSRFDAFLEGKPDALSAAERQGLRTFIDTGCIACHNGVGVGGAECIFSGGATSEGHAPCGAQTRRVSTRRG
jgi:cytochrome c peroxidase